MKLSSLFEDIFRTLNKSDELSISVNTHEHKHRGSDRESIATVQPLPLRATASKTRGIPVYYAYSYLHSAEVTELLKGMKGKNELKSDPRQVTRFFSDTVTYMSNGLKLHRIKPDIIVCPESSSPMTRVFAYQLAEALGVVDVLTSAFVKQQAFKLPDDKIVALRLIDAKFVDHELIADKYHGPDIERFTQRVAFAIYSSFKKSGNLELKGVDKQTSKFIKGFLDADAGIEYALLDKNVLVVDDILSSGSTMSEMLRLVNERLARSVTGAVIFNMTSAKT